MGKKINIAYVGFGKSTNRYHIPYSCLREDIIIKRVINPVLNERPEEQAALEATGTIFSTELSDALSDPEIDLIDIVTPAPFHYSISKQALEAGKNVMCDKPLVEKIEEALELTALAKEKGLMYMPFQNRRFDSDFLTVKKVLETGYLGELTDITVHMDHYRPNEQRLGDNFDGAWYGHGVHMVDQMIALFGKPKAVHYDLKSVRDPESTDDYFNVRMIYDRFTATVAASETSAVPHPKWTLYGSRGVFIKQDVDQQENDLKLFIMPGTPGFGADAPDAFGKLVYHNQNGDRLEKTIPSELGDYGRVYDAVYETLANGAEKLVSDEELLAVIETLEGAFKK
ncbi:Gfo/Idh/MocA family oxidoreductase [Lactovum odontotermitis]